MCGISGYISRDKYDTALFCDTLKHRGPDNTGYVLKNDGASYVLLVHNRLSIIDLSAAGNQPMSDPDDRITIIFNGEIYNFIELRDKYLKGVKLRSSTDTEVLLNLYIKLGIDFIKLLNGDFAIALHDSDTSTTYLVRDRLGVKPLYYYRNASSIFFSSEIKTFVNAGQSLTINESSLKNYFIFKYTPGRSTLFNEVHRCSPGTYMEINCNNYDIKETRYWRSDTREKELDVTYSEAKQLLEELLRDAIDKQLMSDVPVGTLFSGGLDSSTIAYFIRDHKDITHYAARKSESDLAREGSTSDYFYANKLSIEWDLNLIPVDIGADETNSEFIRKTIFYSDDLIADGSQIPSFLITKEASNHSKVLLSGMGADELFYGYAGHQLSLLSMYLDKFPSYLTSAVVSFLSELKTGKGMFKPYKRFLYKVGKYYNRGNSRYGFFNIVGDFENSSSVFTCEDENPALEVFNKYFGGTDDVFKSLTTFELDNFLVKNLHYVDRMCMANSVEGRVPFLDYRLVEFAYGLPRKYKLSAAGNGKRILKDVMRNYLPGYIINRRKAGFGMPLRSIFGNRDKVNSLLDMDFFYAHNGFRPDKIKSIIDNHISGVEENSALIYALVSYQEWHKLFMNK